MSYSRASNARRNADPVAIAPAKSIPMRRERLRVGLPCFRASGPLLDARLRGKGRLTGALPPPLPNGNESLPQALPLFAFFVLAMPTCEKRKSLRPLCIRIED